MTRGITMHQTGASEVLEYKDLPIADLREGEVRIKQHAVGVNRVDINQRNGMYPLPLPSTLGMEGAGEVIECHSSVTDFKVGDRVAYGMDNLITGGYSSQRTIPAEYLIPLPDYIDYQTAAAITMKGIAAYYMLHRTFMVNRDNKILVHAAAGGCANLIVQWARYGIGATVYGTASTQEKADFATEMGCEKCIIYTEESFAPKIKQLTEEIGVNVVYDGVGKSTILKSMDALMPLGLLVNYGEASGKPDNLDMHRIASKGCLFVTRPTFALYTAIRDELLNGAKRLFKLVKSGHIRPQIAAKFKLEEAGKAHDFMEARKNMGSIILTI